MNSDLSQSATNPREPTAVRIARQLAKLQRQLDVVVGMVATVLLLLVAIAVMLLVR